MSKDNIFSLEEKKEQFSLFEYANYCGLLFGVVGAIIIKLILIYMDIGTIINEEGTGLIIIAIVSIILYGIIRDKAYKTIGVSDSIKETYTYTPKTKDFFNIIEHFRLKYKQSSVNKDESLDYGYDDEKNKNIWDSVKRKGSIIVSHKDNEKYDIKIKFEGNSIGVIRPNIRFARTYSNSLKEFLIKKLPKKNLIEDIKFIDELPTDEVV